MAKTTDKRKKAVAAGVAAAAILLAGTFAWTSISQQAKNEAIVDVNPGARLHDDFNGDTLDVYVENFNSADDAAAVPIYARVMLTEYMEVGQEAGDDKIADGTRKALPVGGGVLTDTDTWDIYTPTEDTITNPANVYSKYWTWTMGNDDTAGRYYMPTFDKNKDSLTADINGTYDGTVEDDIVHYDDFVLYGEGDKVTETAVYDWDDDTIDEGDPDYNGEPTVRANDNDPWDSADQYQVEEEHTAKLLSSTAQVITMKEWQGLTDEEKEQNPYWVYDTDGWAYWSKAIEPGKTTGLLMDGIKMHKVPDDNWYYGINAIGQFATAGDLSAFDQPAVNGGGGGMSDAAKDLMAEITDQEGATVSIKGANHVYGAISESYTAAVQLLGTDYGIQPGFTWTVTDEAGNPISGVILDGEGILSISEDAALTRATKALITATSTDGTYTATKTVTLHPWAKAYISHNGGEAEELILDSVRDDVYMFNYLSIQNVNGETVKITLNEEIDFKSTDSDDTNVESVDRGLLQYEAVENDPNAVLVTLVGSAVASTYPYVNNVATPAIPMILHMESGIQAKVYLILEANDGSSAMTVMCGKPYANDTLVDGARLSNQYALEVVSNDSALRPEATTWTLIGEDGERLSKMELANPDYKFTKNGYAYDTKVVIGENAPAETRATLVVNVQMSKTVDGTTTYALYTRSYDITLVNE